MADPPAAGAVPLWRLILIPSVLTLAVTLVRVWGELEQWPTVLFNPTPGGGAALVGITWLVPVFGAYFALKLARGEADVQAGRVLAISILALGVVFAIHLWVGTVKKEQGGQGILGVFAVSSVLGGLVGLSAWPALVRTLLAYGLAARVPVVLVTIAAIRGDWRTHYDQPPPGFPYIGNWLAKWLWIGLLPQMTIWMAYTVIVGSIAGGVALLFAGQRAAPRRPVVPVRRPPAVASPRPILRPPPGRT